MTGQITPEAKLTELTLYIGAKCGLDEYYGVLKLNKILFYSDFRAFRRLGAPITGVQYRKYPHGPAPAKMKMIRERMHESQTAYEYVNPLDAVGADGEEIREKRLLPRRAPNMEVFSSEEIALVDQVIEWLRPMTGRQVSILSHRHPGWRLAELEEEIPYIAALLPDDGSDRMFAAERKWAAAVAERHAQQRLAG